MREKNYIPMPVVVKKDGNYERSYDIFSRLLEERIVFIPNEINDDVASTVVAQLLYLEAQDSKKDINVYINSPGGSISAGMAIYDTMQYIKPDVSIICVGMAASMGAFLLAGGTKGKRYALPNAEILIHQPLGGIDKMTQATDIDIAAKHIMATKKKMCEMLSEFTGKTYDEIYKAIDRDNWMTADEAKDFGLIDKVITKHI